MAKSCVFWATAVLAAALACLARPHVQAADGGGGDVLKKHGLKIVGLLAVVDEEAEIKTKLAEARRLYKQLNYALTQQKGTLSPGELQRIQKNVNNEINQLRSQLNAASQQMNAMPRYRGRLMSNDASMVYSQLAAYRTQVQMEINQEYYFLNQLKSQPSDPKASERIDSEVRDRHNAYHQALLDLRKLVDSAHEKYAELAKSDDVKKALFALGKGQREKPKLGPSHDFLNNVKLFEKAEKAESANETEGQEGQPAKHSRHATKTKHSRKAAMLPTTRAIHRELEKRTATTYLTVRSTHSRRRPQP